MDIPGYRLYPLTGDRRDQWSVRVSGNWRIVYRFVDAGVGASGRRLEKPVVHYSLS